MKTFVRETLASIFFNEYQQNKEFVSNVNEKIGYEKVIGAQPFSVFQRLIDQQLTN